MIKVYLGDSLFAEWDGSQIKLSTGGNVALRSTVYLDHKLMENLYKFYNDILNHKTEFQENEYVLDLALEDDKNEQ